MNAILFLYKNVFPVDLGKIDALRAKKKTYLPVFYTKDEMRRIMAQFREGSTDWIMVSKLETTQIYTHVLGKGSSVQSSADTL